MPKMIRVGGENGEIFWPVVLRVPVYVMYDFTRLKQAPERLLGD
jgi:hypothetical protein